MPSGVRIRLPVLRRGHAVGGVEAPSEVVGAGKAAAKGDFLDGAARVEKQPRRHRQTFARQISLGRLAKKTPEFRR